MQQEPYFSRFQVEIHLFLELKAARQHCRVNFRKIRLIKDRLEVALGGLVAPLLGLELLLDALAGLAIITWSYDQSDNLQVWSLGHMINQINSI